MPARATVEETSPCPNLVTISTESQRQQQIFMFTRVQLKQPSTKLFYPSEAFL